VKLARPLAAILLLATLSVAAGCGSKGTPGSTASTTSAGEASGRPSTGVREIPVTVTDQGFEPARPKIEKGEAVTLVITRKTDQTCATDVMFPRLNLHVDLPLNQPVRVDIPSGAVQDTLYFACGMNMVSGEVEAK
jgi:plastocyanin domain-containing protein